MNAKRTKSKSAAAQTPAPLPPPPPERPPWMPQGEDYQELDDAARESVDRLIDPLYRELVLESDSALARAMGDQFAFLSWVQLARQFLLGPRVGKLPWQLRDFSDINVAHETDRYLQLCEQRLRTGQFLMQEKIVREKTQDATGLVPVECHLQPRVEKEMKSSDATVPVAVEHHTCTE